MGDKKLDHLQSSLERLKAKNQSLRETTALLRGENLNLKKSLRDRNFLFNSIPAGVILIHKGKILEMNEMLLDLLGYSADEVIDHDFLDFVYHEEEEYVRGLHKIWDSGKMAPGQYDVHMVTRGGDRIFCDVHVKRIRFKNKTSFLLNMTRLEKRKEMENEKIELKKREALTTMALGINQNLRRYNEIVLKKIKDYKAVACLEDNESYEVLNELEDASYKIMHISDELEIVAKTENQKYRSSFNLNEEVNEAISSTSRIWKEGSEDKDINIDLKTYLRSSSPVAGDAREIRDVIIHMVINAVEAMPNGGEIHITTEDNSGYGHIYIQDSGIGITHQAMDRVFDPFFSTKEDSSKGLGLSLSYALVKRHKGDIDISSHEGEGTIVHISLPLTVQKHKIKPKADRKKIKDSQIIIVQEEDVVRELLSHLLTIKGCKVDMANNGLEGLGKLKRKKYDLVIADAEMLIAEENTLIKKYRKTNPNMAIALIRGEENQPDGYAETKPNLTIMKPIDVNKALKQVTEVLMERR